MKKICIAFAVLATATLVSCEQEKSFNDKQIGESTLVFSVQRGLATRSAELAPETQQGVIIPLESNDSGTSFYLEETVTSLDEFVPATKGTPAYTENVGTLYANNLSVYGDKGKFTTAATYENMENTLYDGGWRYQHFYPGYPWPDSDDEAVNFYLNMPAAPTNVGITAKENGAFTFTYTSPATAGAQQDILFGSRAVSFNKYIEDYHPSGIPVLMNHALTAVKFRIGNDAADITKNNIAIKEVIFNGLYDKGTCTITPVNESTATSNSATATNWTVREKSATTTALSSGTYSGTVEYKASDKKFGDSWYSATDANTQNLNDANATQTFWLIPQAFTTSNPVTLTIKYTIGGKPYEWTIDFGSVLAAKNVEWKAGELRTYTIRVDDVNVTITDQFTTTVKNNVQIKNTGNTAAYIRAAIIGQWVDQDDKPVFGYTDYKTGEIAVIRSWYEDYVNKTGYFGSFAGLPGNGWTEESDGYYYYETPVEPDQSPTALFTSYTVVTNNIPSMTVGGKEVDAKLLIEVSTQAVTAKKLDGSTFTRAEAWANAKTKAQQ